MGHLRNAFIAIFLALPVSAWAEDPLGLAGGEGGFEYVTSVEGIHEYALPNGLQVLLFPDGSQARATVNVTYRVGSMHENYGETGMAHLLEHLLFKGTPDHPDITGDFAERGMAWNGTTWLDRTNYFESFEPTNGNLEWALRMEADRMVNSFISYDDLQSEFTVVRNEMERGENNPSRMLSQRIRAAAYEWHNYGNSTIGARSDVEGVDIGRLQAFYRAYYQPDNATLIVAGDFDIQGCSPSAPRCRWTATRKKFWTHCWRRRRESPRSPSPRRSLNGRGCRWFRPTTTPSRASPFSPTGCPRASPRGTGATCSFTRTSWRRLPLTTSTRRRPITSSAATALRECSFPPRARTAPWSPRAATRAPGWRRWPVGSRSAPARNSTPRRRTSPPGPSSTNSPAAARCGRSRRSRAAIKSFCRSAFLRAAKRAWPENTALRAIAGARGQPRSMVSVALSKALSPYGPNHFRYAMDLDEQEEMVRGMSRDALKEFWNTHAGFEGAVAAVVGNVDSAALAARLDALFGDWDASVGYSPAPRRHYPVESRDLWLDTPDKANGVMVAALPIAMNVRDEDYPALAIGMRMFGGGGMSNRLMERLRQKEGWSYGAGGGMNASSREGDDSGSLMIQAIAAPENLAKVKAGAMEELQRALDDGFTAEELKDAVDGAISSDLNSWSSDASLAGILRSGAEHGLDANWHGAMHDRYRALTLEEVNDTFRKHFRADDLLIFIGGDRAKAEAGA